MNKKTNVIIMWLIAIGLVLGMVLMFTPNLGFGGAGVQQGDVVMRVNGEPITDLEINRVRNANPIYYAVTEGEVGEDLRLLAMDAIVTEELLRQAAAPQRVTNAEISASVNAFREDRGVAGRSNDSAYLSLLAGAGFDDSAFRDYMRDQLRQQKWEASVIGEVEVTDEEVTTFYDVFRDSYRTDERIVARSIAVADQEFANELRTRVLTGESFAELAAEHSLDRADRAGALGAVSGTTEPQPTGRAALPVAVSNAAFNLRAAGLTGVVEANNMFWFVQVEEFQAPEYRPFDEVADQVRQDALASKQIGLVSAEIERLMEEASIETVEESEFDWNNPVVATVGDEEIRQADLARNTYGNPEVQQFLDPSLTFLVTDILKPQILDQLIDQTVAYVGAVELDGEFFGTEQQIAQHALNYVSRDVSLTEEEIQAWYEDNLDTYTQNPEAQVVSYDFDSFEAAEDFRDTVLAGSTPTDAAQAAGITPEIMGTVRPGLSEPAINDALFQTDAFESIDTGSREISDVLFIAAATDPGPSEDEAGAEDTDEALEAAATDEAAAAAAEEADPAETGDGAEADADLAADVQEAAGEAAAAVVDGEPAGDVPADESPELDPELVDTLEDEAAAAEEEPRDRYVVLVADRTPERVRPLEEVRDMVSDSVLAAKRAEAQQDWLAQVREGLVIENFVEVTTPDPADPFGDIDFSPEDVTGIIDEEPADAEEVGTDGPAAEETETDGSALEAETDEADDSGTDAQDEGSED